MKVKLVSDETTFYKKAWESVVEINGKTVRIGSYDEQDMVFSQYDSGHDIDEDDLKKLTEEEHEVLGEYMDDILGGKVGEEWETEEVCEKCGLPHSETDCDKK